VIPHGDDNKPGIFPHLGYTDALKILFMKIFFCLISLIISVGLAGCRSDVTSGSDFHTQAKTPSKTPQIGVDFVTVSPTIISQIDITETATQATTSPISSPTPFIYLVESGDTLFDIAAFHNLTTQEITELNPDLDPSFLLVGQEIVLPELATAPEPTPIPTTASVEVELSGLNKVESSTGGNWLFGEVFNGTGQSVENIVVNLQLIDDAMQLFEEELVWVASNILEPDERAPFGLLINSAPEGNVNLHAQIVSADAVVDAGNRYTNFEVIDSEVTIGDSRVRVDGQIHNTGQSVANSISIIVTIYDGSGRVTGYTVKELAEPMNPDERRSFVLDALPPGPDSVDISLIVEGFVLVVED